LPADVAALRAIHFDGWVTVELDHVPSGSGRTPKECAELSKIYIERTLESKSDCDPDLMITHDEAGMEGGLARPDLLRSAGLAC